jgi:quercetin dioxygenase-like cupin family protein
MTKKVALWVATVAILTSISCAQPESEPEPAEQTAAPVTAEADPTVVDAAHYTAEFENDQVRIVRITYGAGEESVMHYHPDSVAVFLTDQVVQMTLLDGTAEELPAKAGEAIFTPAGQHLPKNVSDVPLEVVLVELGSGGAAASEADGPDATVVDAAHYTAEFENDQVRIVRITYGPGEESVMHHHPDSVAIFLTDQVVQMTLPDGTAEELPAKAGEAIFTPAGQHLPKNVSDAPLELVLVELQ